MKPKTKSIEEEVAQLRIEIDALMQLMINAESFTDRELYKAAQSVIKKRKQEIDQKVGELLERATRPWWKFW